MPDVVGIRFKSCGKIYDFEVSDLEFRKGDAVVVESELGLSIGSIVTEPHSVESPPKELKKVLRRAGENDLRQKSDNEGLETDARAYCLERIMARGLPMKLICTEVTLDRKRIIFYFAAEGRIDFRELVKDLAARFKTRIEMRQIGVRDEAKMLGGLGVCGRELCCKKFLTTFEPISIKMAKSQELVLNANKLSGVCGRLMCCLSYEYNDGDDEPRGREKESRKRSEEQAVPDTAGQTPAPAESKGVDSEEEPGMNTGLLEGRPFRADALEPAREEASGQGTGEAGPGSPGAAAPSAQQGAEGEKRPHRRRRRNRRRHRR